MTAMRIGAAYPSTDQQVPSQADQALNRGIKIGGVSSQIEYQIHDYTYGSSRENLRPAV